MKAIKISDQLHGELTSVLGQLIAESGQIKTYENAIQAPKQDNIANMTVVDFNDSIKT